MQWLVTAFEPFAQAQTNSSQIVLKTLRQEDKSGRIRFLDSVPVSFEKSWPAILAELDRYPQIQGVLALGQSGRPRLNLENVALNWIDARVQDNDGVTILRQPVTAGAAEILWTQIPWHQFEPRPNEVEMSYSAGVYVCNQVFYKSNQWSRDKGEEGRRLAGFVHIPTLASQTDLSLAKAARMPDEQAVEAMRAILRFVLSI